MTNNLQDRFREKLKQFQNCIIEREQVLDREDIAEATLQAAKRADEMVEMFSSEVEQARKEERERFSSWIAEGCAEAFTLIGLAKFLREKLVSLSTEENKK